MAANFWQSSHCHTWLLDSAQLERSRESDVRLLGSELEVRFSYMFFADIIQQLGRSLDSKLKVKQQVIATATVYFRRFFARNPLSSIDCFLVALTCMYLATKAEEAGPLMVKHLNRFLTQSKDGIALKRRYKQVWGTFRDQDIIECEFFLIQEMDCCLVVFHPYRCLADYCKDANQTDVILPLAWSTLNDLYKSDLPLMYPPHLLALGCMQFASSLKKVDLTSWFAELCVSTSELVEVTQHILDLYGRLEEYTKACEAVQRSSVPRLRGQTEEGMGPV